LYFALHLLLSIKLPQLGVDLLLEHTLLMQAALFDKLLLALNGSSEVIKLRVFFAQGIV
jgi:hypothetical protein